MPTTLAPSTPQLITTPHGPIHVYTCECCDRGSLALVKIEVQKGEYRHLCGYCYEALVEEVN